MSFLHQRTLDSFVRRVGEERFEKACAQAVESAQHTGKETPSMQDALWVVPHDISEEIWREAEDEATALELVFALYQRMPCYAVLENLQEHYDDISEMGRAVVFARYRQFLATDDPRLARPVEYSLWCDYFNDPGRVDDIWNIVLREPREDAVVRRVLMISGPVPFDLKLALYDELIGNPDWHYFIFQSLLYSATTDDGQVDAPAARTVLSRLDLDDNEAYLSHLIEALS